MSYLLEHIKTWYASYILGIAGIYFMLNVGKSSLLDFPNLFIHEAGHLIFFIFGNFICALGGTLMQILLPSFLAFMFWRYQNVLFTQLSIFWLGHNFLSISVYAGDADKMKLRLIGKTHDWNYILNQIGLIEYANHIKILFIIFGGISFLFAIIIPYFLFNRETD